MAAPSSYTEATFKTYLHTVLGDVATVLGWTVGAGSYDELVNETLLVYGTADITTISDSANIRKLRALGRVQVWRQAVAGLAAKHDFKTDGQEFTLSDLQKQAKEALALAESDALSYGGTYAVGVDSLTYVHDPYRYVEDDDRVSP